MTTPTERELFEEKLRALRAEHELQFKAIYEKFAALDEARKLQAAADKEHFSALNNEAARIQKAADLSVSRDTWDAFKQTDQKWKSDIEKLAATHLPRQEFQTYKETTDKARDVKTGQTQGVSMVWAIFLGIVAVAGVMFGIFRP